MSAGSRYAPEVGGKKSWARGLARVIVLGWAAYWLYFGVKALLPPIMASGWQDILLAPTIVVGLIVLPLLTIWRLEGFTATLFIIEVVAGVYYFRIIDLVLNPLLTLNDGLMIAGMFVPPLIAAILLIKCVIDRPRPRMVPVKRVTTVEQESKLSEEPIERDVRQVAS